MKMSLSTRLQTKYEASIWLKNSELGLFDRLLEAHPELLDIIKEDVMRGQKSSNFGRGDMPSVEQILRAAFYKEFKGLDYRDLEWAQIDSRSCAAFIKLDPSRLYSFQMYQSYISKISEESLGKLMLAINKLAIEEGMESVERFRQDSFVVESNVHYPTKQLPGMGLYQREPPVVGPFGPGGFGPNIHH